MKYLLKEYFSFSRGDKNAFAILLTILLLVIFSPLIYKTFFHKNTEMDYHAFREEILAFELMQKRKAQELEENKKVRQSFNYTSIDRSVKEVRLSPFPFNPNNLPTAEWEKMGLTDRQIKGIKNYEGKGGRFFIKEDLKKMYAISEEEYLILEPFIDLPDKREKKTFTPTHKEAEIIRIEVNGADTSALKMLKGVGSKLSSRIIKYRETLGGFCHKEQLLEVWGIDTALFKTIEPYITIDKSLINASNVNEISLNDLAKHPYISRNVAMSIVNMRNMHGNYKSISDIMKSELIDDALYYKIAPYLKI